MSVRIDDPDASRQARGGGPRLGLLVVVALVVAAVLAWSFVPTGDRSEESSDPVRGTRAAPEAGEMAQGTAETGTGGATRQVAGVPRGFPQTVDGAVQSYVASLGLFTAGMATLSAEQLQAFVRDFTLTDTSYARVQADKRAMLGLDESGAVIDARPGDAVVASCPAALGAYRTSDVTPTSGAPTSVAVGYWGPCVYGVGSAENRDRLSIVWQQTTATMTWRDGDWRLDTTRPGSAEQAPVPVDLNRPETSFGQRADLLGDGWELFDGADESWPTTLLGPAP